MLSLLLSWIEHPNNTPSTLHYIHFSNLGTDDILFLKYAYSTIIIYYLTVDELTIPVKTLMSLKNKEEKGV